MRRRCLTALAAMLIASAAIAQQQIPTPDEFLGYKLGERFTPYERIVDYFGELSKRSDLITLQTFGQTYERRPLVLATITSARNRAALQTIHTNIAALAGGDADRDRAAEIARTTPAVVWLAFGVHGNETSSAEAAMLVASTLLRDPDAAHLLDDLVVIIDPLQNPDGRERYTSWFRRTEGAEPNPNPDAFEHFENWPGGRFNHYLVDMNRDWSWTSQQETRARVVQYLQWYPQVFVDFHEMGYESSYFFPPDAKPINANLPGDVEKWLDIFGRANAEAFSKRGWPFFVGERFDLFYPGYGDSWPSLHGAIGMTYEVGGHGRAGLAIEREDSTVLTLEDRIQRHYTTAMASVRTAAANREALLKYTWDAMRIYPQSGKNVFLIVPGAPNFRELTEMLQRQGVRMFMLTAPATLRAARLESDIAESHTFPAGTAVLSTRQPLGALVQTLLERNATMSKTFLEEQRVKAEADEPDDFYDLTTWSLPLAMNVEAWTATAMPDRLSPFAAPAAPLFAPAGYGYLVSALEPNLYRLIGRLLRDDVKFSAAEEDVVVANTTYPRGSIVILKGNNAAALDARLGDAANALGVRVISLESGWAGGTALGSEKLHFVKQPKIAIVGGPPSSSTSFGMLWHTLDIDTPIPHSVVSADSLRHVDLNHYRVLIFPDGDYDDRFGKNTIEKLKNWVRAGGTIIAIKGANGFLRAKDVEISKLKSWEPPKKKDDDKQPPQEERYNEPRVPGSAFRTSMNQRSYLTFGVPRPPAVLVEGSAAYVPVSHRIDNIVTIAEKDPLVSGVAWPESLERIRGSVYLVSETYGSGNVITFSDEPHFRLFWRGTLPLFLNAAIYSPSFSR